MFKTSLFDYLYDKRRLEALWVIPDAGEELNRSVSELRKESMHSIKSLWEWDNGHMT